MNTSHLNKIREIILKLAIELNSKNYIWFLGGSGGLMVHGVNIIPHDIDVFVENNRIEELCQKFQNILKNHYIIIFGITNLLDERNF